MRVKLDENLPLQLRRLFTESGHDAATVLDQGIGGATDADIASVCHSERSEESRASDHPALRSIHIELSVPTCRLGVSLVRM